MELSSPHIHRRTFFRQAAAFSRQMRPMGVPFFLLLCGMFAHAGNSSLVIHRLSLSKAVDPGIIAKDQTICAGGTPALLTSASPATGHDSYRWEASTDNGANWATATGTNDGETYQSGPLTETTIFRRVAVSAVDGEKESDPVTITVNPIPPAPTVPKPVQTFCEGATVADLKASGAGVQWYAAATGGDPLPPASELVDNTDYYASQSVDNCESADRVAVTARLVILSPGQIGPDDQIVCAGGKASILDIKNQDDGLGGEAYFWQQSVTGNDGDWADVPGATDRWHLPETEDAHYRRGKSAPADDKTCTVYSNVLSVKVNLVHPGEIGPNQLICHGDVPATLPSKTEATGLGKMAYQWQVSANGSLNWTDIPSATDATYTPSEPLTDTRMYRRWATSPVLANSGACMAGSNILTVKISEAHPGGIAGDQTICPDTAPADLTSTGKGTGTTGAAITYRWESSTDGWLTWDIIPGTPPKVATYWPGKLTVTTEFRRVAIATTADGSCEAASAPVTVWVNDIYGGAISADQTICENGTPTPITSGGLAVATGTVTYGWESWTEDSGKWKPVPNANGEGYAPPGPMVADAKFRRVAFADMGSGTVCAKPTDPVTVTVSKVNGGNIDRPRRQRHGRSPIRMGKKHGQRLVLDRYWRSNRIILPARSAGGDRGVPPRGGFQGQQGLQGCVQPRHRQGGCSAGAHRAVHAARLRQRFRQDAGICGSTLQPVLQMVRCANGRHAASRRPRAG